MKRGAALTLGALASTAAAVAASTMPSFAAALDELAGLHVRFDELPSGTLLEDQISGLRFSSKGESRNFVYAFAGASSAPNIVCTGGASLSYVNCAADTYVDFSQGVDELRFWAIEPNNEGMVGKVRVFTGGKLAGTVDLLGRGGGGRTLVDLSRFRNVTRIEIVDIADGGGIGWDDFSFRWTGA